jgi:hypothetical protein
MNSIVVALLLMQGAFGDIEERSKWLEIQRKSMEQKLSFAEERELEEKRLAAVDEYFFVQKYNKFIEALKEFTENYEAGTVDIKKARAVTKAWRALEKTEGWLKADKSQKQQCQPSR